MQNDPLIISPCRSRPAIIGFALALAAFGLLPFTFVVEGNPSVYLMGLAFVLALAALILGIVAFVTIRRSQGRRTGRRLADWSVPLAILCLVGLGVSLGFQVYRTMVRMFAEDLMCRPILIAMHQYNDDHQHLPPQALCDEEGRPLLSWRVLLLPYLQEEALYKEFQLDEPWDSPHNIKLLPRMPQVYSRPTVVGRRETERTHFQVFVGEGSVFDDAPGFKPPSIGQIVVANGLENTILLAEAYEPVPWTKPEDLRFDRNTPLPRLGGVSRAGFIVVRGDRSFDFVWATYPYPEDVEERIRKQILWREADVK